MLDKAIITLFFIANVVIGFLASRGIRTFSHYAVWQRAFGTFAICATLTASFVGGGYIMGNAAKVFDGGIIYAFGLLGFSLKEVLVARFVAPRMQAYRDCHSVGEIMAKHYGKQVQFITGIFSMLICMGILGAQVSAMGALLSTFFQINTSISIILGFGIIMIYAVLGGMRGVVYTDVLQFLVLVIGIPLIFIWGLHMIGGFSVISQHLPANYVNPFTEPFGFFKLMGLMLTFMFGEILVPPYVQRLFMAKSTKQTERATYFAGLLSAPIFLLAGGVGLIALIMNPNIVSNQAIPYVIEQSMPVGLRGFVIASLLAVIMSSAAGFLNAGAIAFSNDILPLCWNSNAWSHRQQVFTARLVSFIIGLGAIIFALSIKNILDILIHAYDFWSPIILVPLLVAIFNGKTTVRLFFFCAVSGLLATIISWLIAPQNAVISNNVWGVFTSLIVYSIFKK